MTIISRQMGEKEKEEEEEDVFFSITTVFNAQSTMTITSRQMGKKEEKEEEEEIDVFKHYCF